MALCNPSLRDRIVQQALLNVLHPIMEPQFEDCSFAYRPGRSHKLAAEQVRYWHHESYDWVLDADIVKYFNNVGHRRLLQEFKERLKHPDFLELIGQWIGSPTVSQAGLILPEKGLPQGSVVSPILANIYLDDFDEYWLKSKLKLVRYADDFVLLGRSEAAVFEAQEQVIAQLKAMGELVLHPEKTQITNFERGFRFLGYAFAKDVMVPLTRQVRKPEQPPSTSTPYRIVHADAPPTGPTQMQLAMLEALKQEQKPIPPPLYVLLGYQVRKDGPVKIESKEEIWRTNMATVYLVDQGSVLQKHEGRFRIKRLKESTVEIPIREVERVLVFGNVQLTTQAMTVCLQQSIPVVFLSQLGLYKGHLWSAASEDVDCEAAQFRRWEDRAFQLETARAVAWGKLMNSKQLMLRLNRRRKSEVVTQAITGITADIAAVERANHVESLRGHEGVAAVRYFKALGHLITNEAFEFVGRTRRPPKDPVNSLLSFGYTLLYNNVMSLILVEGLNPYLGNLHRSERKNTHLAFDLMEEFRSPVVDSLVLRLVNKKIFQPTDFTWPKEQGGIYLTQQARRVFINKIEERLGDKISHPDVEGQVSYRRVIQLQVQRYKRSLLKGIPYEAFLRSI